MADDFSWLAPILGAVGNLATSRLGMNTANQAAGMADPFSGERGAYQTQLRDYMGANSVNPAQVTAGTNSALSSLMALLNNPSSITQNPAYKAGLGFGTEAVNRGAGASGMLNSGNRLLGLEKFGQDYGMNFYDQIVREMTGAVNTNINAANLGLNAQGQGYQQLANLSGVNVGSPGIAGGLLNQGRQNQINGWGEAAGGLVQGGAGALSALQRLLNGGGMSGSFNGDPFGTGGDWGGLSGSFGGEPYGPPSDLFGDFDNWDLMGNLGGGGSDFLDLGAFL